MTLLPVACVQMRSGVTVERNVADAAALIREAAAGGARLVATPEMTTLLDRTPGSVFRQSVAEEADASVPVFQALARELNIWLLIGSMPFRANDRQCFNRSLLISPRGGLAARYDKIHMFDVQLNAGNVYRESEGFLAGEQAVLADVDGAKLGLTVCYDVRFPHLFRKLAKAGAQILSVPAAFTRITGEAHWHVLLRARAIETGCFVIAPAQAGKHEDGRETYGHSLIIAPWGEVLADAGGAEPGVISAALDLSLVDSARGKVPALTHDREISGL